MFEELYQCRISPGLEHDLSMDDYLAFHRELWDIKQSVIALEDFGTRAGKKIVGSKIASVLFLLI